MPVLAVFLSREFCTGKIISCELLSAAGNYFQRRPTSRERLSGLDDVSDARGANIQRRHVANISFRGVSLFPINAEVA